MLPHFTSQPPCKVIGEGLEAQKGYIQGHAVPKCHRLHLSPSLRLQVMHSCPGATPWQAGQLCWWTAPGWRGRGGEGAQGCFQGRRTRAGQQRPASGTLRPTSRRIDHLHYSRTNNKQKTRQKDGRMSMRDTITCGSHTKQNGQGTRYPCCTKERLHMDKAQGNKEK